MQRLSCRFWVNLYQKIKELKISDTQAYKMAGNSIVVNCLTEIFKKLKELGNSYFPDDFTNMPLMNNSVIWDLWLKKNCDIDFVTQRIDEQYSGSYMMQNAKDFDFNQESFVMSIERKDPDSDLLLYFFMGRYL